MGDNYGRAIEKRSYKPINKTKMNNAIYGFCTVRRSINIWGAIEESPILLSRYEKNKKLIVTQK